MSPRPLSRRYVLVRAAALAAGALVGAACSGGSDDPSIDAEGPVAFAARWRDLVDPSLHDLGVRAVVAAPAAIAHARERLGDVVGDDDELRAALAEACRRDALQGRLDALDGWLLPRTLIGVVAAVSVDATT